jgi:uncharacterized protein
VSAENVDFVRRAHEAFPNLDEVPLELLDPEIEWDMSDRVFNPAVYHGHEGVRRFAQEAREVWEEWRSEPEKFFDAGDQVVVFIRVLARGRGSGAPAEDRSAGLWTLRDGKAVRFKLYRDRTQALEAAGLGEVAPGSDGEVVLRGYEAFNRGDIEGALDYLHPEIEWKTYLVPGPGGGTYRGHQGVRELWSDARTIFGDFRNDPERVIDVGDKVLAFITVCGRGRESGVEVKAQIAHVLTVRDGKVIRVESFEDRGQALREAGL